MALSEQEQRLLDEMERHLYQNDADVVSTEARAGAGVSARSLVLTILAVVVGLGIVLGALAAQSPIVGVVGFVVMLVGVLLAFRPNGRAPRRPAAAAPKGGKPSAGGSKGAPRGFMDNLEDRWDRRRKGE